MTSCVIDVNTSDECFERFESSCWVDGIELKPDEECSCEQLCIYAEEDKLEVIEEFVKIKAA